MIQDNNYRSKDIFEASWIYSQNIPFLGLEPDGKYFWFVFENKNIVEPLASQYWSQKATGNIKYFVNSLKTLKDFVFSKKQDK